MPESEFRNRAAFAEYADALNIDTIDILAVMPSESGAHVLYSTGTEDLHTARLWAVGLKRDNAGVLTRDTVPKEILGGLDKLAHLMEKD